MRARHPNLRLALKQVKPGFAALRLKVTDVGYTLLSACGSHSLKPSSGNRVRKGKLYLKMDSFLFQLCSFSCPLNSKEVVKDE